MIVVLSNLAERRIRETADYILDEFGRRSRDAFMQKLRQAGRLLADSPHLGPIEPLLADLPYTYRSLVVGRLNKIVYRITDNYIEIVDLWDTRREPREQSARVE